VIRRYLLRNTHAAWYAGRLGLTVRFKGMRITMPNRLLAGVLRLRGYERAECAAVQRFLPADLPVVELGAGTGVVSCLANRKLSRPELHRCAEPNPAAQELLRHNRDQNCCRFEIVNAAFGYQATGRMAFDEHVVASRVNTGEAEVPMRSLQALAQGFERFSLICDIEGAEIDIVERERDVVANRLDTFIVERHPGIVGTEADARFHESVLACGLRKRWSSGPVYVYQR
jgi:FkbM family methyltransferase